MVSLPVKQILNDFAFGRVYSKLVILYVEHPMSKKKKTQAKIPAGVKTTPIKVTGVLFMACDFSYKESLHGEYYERYAFLKRLHLLESVDLIRLRSRQIRRGGEDLYL